MARCNECIHEEICQFYNVLACKVLCQECGFFINKADVVPKSEVEKQKVWIFDNSPFEMLDIAFKRLFPNVKYTAFFEPNIRDDEHGEKVCGLTDFADDGEITIFIDTDLSINDAVEIFAHELAHAGVGVEQEHNEKWQKAFDDLFNEYNKIGDEMFGSNIDAPKGESYSNALSEIEKIKREVAREIFEEIDDLDIQLNNDDLDIKYFGSAIAELKKKYTEGEQNE